MFARSLIPGHRNAYAPETIDSDRRTAARVATSDVGLSPRPVSLRTTLPRLRRGSVGRRLRQPGALPGKQTVSLGAVWEGFSAWVALEVVRPRDSRSFSARKRPCGPALSGVFQGSNAAPEITTPNPMAERPRNMCIVASNCKALAAYFLGKSPAFARQILWLAALFCIGTKRKHVLCRLPNRDRTCAAEHEAECRLAAALLSPIQPMGQGRPAEAPETRTFERNERPVSMSWNQ